MPSLAWTKKSAVDKRLLKRKIAVEKLSPRSQHHEITQAKQIAKEGDESLENAADVKKDEDAKKDEENKIDLENEKSEVGAATGATGVLGLLKPLEPLERLGQR